MLVMPAEKVLGKQEHVIFPLLSNPVANWPAPQLFEVTGWLQRGLPLLSKAVTTWPDGQAWELADGAAQNGLPLLSKPLTKAPATHPVFASGAAVAS